MKTIKLLILTVLCTSVSVAQIDYVQSSKQLSRMFEEMLDQAKNQTSTDSGKPCFANADSKELTKNELMPDGNKMLEAAKNLILATIPPAIGYRIDLGIFGSDADKAANAINNSSSFSEFVSAYTGIDLGDHSKTDLDLLRAYYDRHPFRTNEGSILVSGIDISKKDCNYRVNSFLLPQKSKLPDAKYIIKTEIWKFCDCYAADETKPYKAVTIYEGSVSGKFGSNRISFLKMTNPTKKVVDVICCAPRQAERGDLNEPYQTLIQEDINYALPDQYIGGTAGVGLEQDFEETSICLGAEYGYQLSETNNGGAFYVGAEANFSTTSFMDFSNTWISVGPQLQSWCPITPSKEVHWVNEIEGAYVFGSQENNGFKDDINGLTVGLNTGFNIALNKKFSIGLEIPVVSYQNLTFESENGGAEFKVDDTSIFINKNNPATVSLRYNLGN